MTYSGKFLLEACGEDLGRRAKVLDGLKQQNTDALLCIASEWGVALDGKEAQELLDIYRRESAKNPSFGEIWVNPSRWGE